MPPIFTQDVAPDVRQDESLDNPVKLNFNIRLTQTGTTRVWQQYMEKYTISGKAVSLKLAGANLKYLGYFTPFMLKEDKIKIYIQSQIFLSSEESNSFKYFTSFKTAVVSYGEKIVFYPLGMKRDDPPDDIPASNIVIIEIEITVFPAANDDGTKPINTVEPGR